ARGSVILAKPDFEVPAGLGVELLPGEAGEGPSGILELGAPSAPDMLGQRPPVYPQLFE
uniref:Aggrecan (Fragments) n=1 Tax=Bos taurus TaxID=9913 RepID=Q7M381_BOVIN